MKTIIHYIALLLLSLLLFSCSEDLVEQVQTGTLKGVVIKKGTNQPLKNVKISTAPTSETVFSAEDGTFSITNVPLGDYSVRAELQGYLTNLQGVNIKNKDQTVSVVFEMADDQSLNTPPSVPVLITPVDNAVDQPLNVQLTWLATDADSLDVLKYTLTVRNSLDNEVLTVKDLTEPTYSLENLKFGVTYYWQVAVSDGIHPAVNSATFRFTTSATPENRFHYVRKENGNYVIYSSNEANENFKFSSASFNSWRPRMNQNAKLIAFLRTVGGNAQIHTARPDGSGVMQVTAVPVAGFNNAELDFAWSKNGKELLYPNFTKLYRINKDGSGLQLVHTTPDGSFITECEWSYDGSKIAVKTNDANGYNVKIYIIDVLGNMVQTVLQNVPGAAGGLSFSVDGTKLLYSYDVSGHQDADYRQLDTHLFIYDLNAATATDISVESEKPVGMNDLDPRFSPNDAEVIFVSTSNDGISQRVIMKITLQDYNRTNLFPDAEMPDWE